ncbi:MAG: F0F1 ATP synthase subunit A [Polyangiaceae bacterium]|nr:F0F1 ATP synthase subunit A [Polyangiaceae bacterium]
MPEHTTFLSFLIQWLMPHGDDLAKNFGPGVISHTEPTWQSWEPPITALLIVLIMLALGWSAKSKFAKLDDAVVPDNKLNVRTFFEVFLGFFHSMACDVMGPERAKRYFPIVGAGACFVFFGNVIGLFPGLMNPYTSSLNTTIAAALLVFVLFNYYGFRANGLGYLKHMGGPWLGPIGIPLNIMIFIIEVISTCVRPVTMSVRLMLNIAVDHLLGSVFLGLFALLVPVPVMFLGLIVVVVQTLIFTLLTSIYISLATEHEDHGPAHGKDGHGKKSVAKSVSAKSSGSPVHA